MNDTWKQLRSAFLGDLQQLTNGYQELLQAIEQDDFEQARHLAQKLDRLAGPHIEFEERYLYPQVECQRGEAYAMRLYDEHLAVLDTLISIQQSASQTAPNMRTKQSWMAGIEQGFQHDGSINMLLSHLESLGPHQQAEMLESLERLRTIGRCWSDLHPLRDRMDFDRSIDNERQGD